MRTTLTTERRHEAHPSTESLATTSAPAGTHANRVGILDRAALHLGVALIKWGRRPAHHAARSERRANRTELALLLRDQRLALASLERQDLALDYTSRLAPLR